MGRAGLALQQWRNVPWNAEGLLGWQCCGSPSVEAGKLTRTATWNGSMFDPASEQGLRMCQSSSCLQCSSVPCWLPWCLQELRAGLCWGCSQACTSSGTFLVPGLFPACFQELPALGLSALRSVMHIRECLVQTSWMALRGQDTIVSWCLVLFFVQFALGFSAMHPSGQGSAQVLWFTVLGEEASPALLCSRVVKEWGAEALLWLFFAFLQIKSGVRAWLHN